MKTAALMLLICCTFISVHAQLANTKWKVTLDIPDPTDVVFNFKADTVEVLSAEDNQSIETMVYTVKDSVLTLQKVTGQSDCDDTTVGKYKFQITNEEMYVTLMDDPCEDRSDALNNNQKWEKIP